jgi:hypothetical protein
LHDTVFVAFATLKLPSLDGFRFLVTVSRNKVIFITRLRAHLFLFVFLGPHEQPEPENICLVPSGIGFDTCRGLHCKGATVVVGSRNAALGEEAVRKLMRVDGPTGHHHHMNHPTVVTHQLDVTDPESIRKTVHYIKKHYGRFGDLFFAFVLSRLCRCTDAVPVCCKQN